MNNTNLEKKIQKAYAGLIEIDKQGNIENKYISNPLIKLLYKRIWRHCIAYTNVLIGLTNRGYMLNEGILHWDVGMYSDEFIIYSIRTKKGNRIQTLKKLFSEAEKVAKIKGFKEIFGFSNVIRTSSAKKFGWNSEWYGNGFRFIKNIK